MFIAVDPGKMCGLFAVYEDGTISFAMEAPPLETVSWVDAKLHIAPDARIIVERYAITPATIKMTREYDALETIGALRYVALKHRRHFALQARADRLRMSNEHLKRIGWFTQTPGGHTNDAARHCFLAFMKAYPDHDLVKQLLDTI